jgi:hypothetical protein
VFAPRPAAPRIAVAAVLLAALAGRAAAAADAEHVVIVTIDGPRASEALDGPGRANMPFLWQSLAPRGAWAEDFRNEGETKTEPGHATIVTGTWQRPVNDGSERPARPTIFERLREARGAPASACAVVASKKKLAAVAFSTAPGAGERFGARVDVPILPLRSDEDTLRAALAVLARDRPALALVAFAGPDVHAHLGDRPGYLEAIRRADALTGDLWRAIEADPALAGKTALLVTSDHGRHDDAHGGFASHGCGCAGCRRIPFFAIGAGIRAGVAIPDGRQVDVAPTAARLLDLDLGPVEGRALEGILVHPRAAPAAEPAAAR